MPVDWPPLFTCYTCGVLLVVGGVIALVWRLKARDTQEK